MSLLLVFSRLVALCGNNIDIRGNKGSIEGLLHLGTKSHLRFSISWFESDSYLHTEAEPFWDRAATTDKVSFFPCQQLFVKSFQAK